MKLRWPARIAAFFRPDEAAKTVTNARVLLYTSGLTFLRWFGGWRRPESGDRMRERTSPARGERSSESRYGVGACTIHLYCQTLYTVGSRMNRSDGCDWLDLRSIGRSG